MFVDLVVFDIAGTTVYDGDAVHRCLADAVALAGVAVEARFRSMGAAPADLLEGTAAGCGFVVGVTSGAHTAGELEAHPHTHLISSLRELLPIVEGAKAGERAPGDTSTPLLFT